MPCIDIAFELGRSPEGLQRMKRNLGHGPPERSLERELSNVIVRDSANVFTLRRGKCLNRLQCLDRQSLAISNSFPILFVGSVGCLNGFFANFNLLFASLNLRMRSLTSRATRSIVAISLALACVIRDRTSRWAAFSPKPSCRSSQKATASASSLSP